VEQVTAVPVEVEETEGGGGDQKSGQYERFDPNSAGSPASPRGHDYSQFLPAKL
jgi:hypothetical protein